MRWGNNSYETGEQTTDTAETPARRQVLKAGAATAAATTGLGATTGSGSAGALNCASWPDAPGGYPEIDLETWDVNYDINSDDEVTIYVHGWNELGMGADQAYTLEQGLNSEYGWWWNEYPGTVMCARWDSTTLDFGGAWEHADEIGNRLAWFIDDNWWRQNTLNIVGHSLGARATLSALDELKNRDARVNNVVIAGAAAHDYSVCSGERYHDGVRDAADSVTSLQSSEDFAVCGAYELWPEWLLQDALGCKGPDCGWFSSTPDNFDAIDVSYTVGNHCEYFTEDGSGADDRILSALGY